MRNATFHPASTRSQHPRPRSCATCFSKAHFTNAGKPICGPCLDRVIEAEDAAKAAANA